MVYKEEVILRKLKGHQLSFREINEVVKRINAGLFTDAEIAYFVQAIAKHGMSMQETSDLTRAMAYSGDMIRWGSRIVADKHCIGGIPGNRTTPIVVSICAAAGLTMPKTSSRSITSAAGTADVVEVLASVSHPVQRLKRIVKRTGACLAWGGAIGIAPADEKLIRIERKLNIDPGPQIVASILSKKIAAGSNRVLIDIPVGRGAKFSLAGGKKLASYFRKVAADFNLKLDIVFTDGSQPIGNGVGPVLEILDVLSVLKCEGRAKDLEAKSVFLAGKLLEMSGKAEKGKGIMKAKDILYSGEALKKFNEIINAQGRVKNPRLSPGEFSHSIRAERRGTIRMMNNKEINSLGKVLGCPAMKRSGIYLHHHVGEKVEKGHEIATIYSEKKSKLDEAKIFLKKNAIFVIK